MLFLLTISFILSRAFSAITLSLDGATQDYYFRFAISADSRSCSISNVAILVNGAWTDSDNNYDNSYDWNYNGIKFGDMEPISVKITTSNGNSVELWGAITSNNPGAVYVINKSLCNGSPVAVPTPQPVTPTKPTTPYPTSDSICMDRNDMKWESYNNQIYLNGNRFNLKGLSWFGFETGNKALFGLDKHNTDWYLNWIIDNGFNAIRLPFSSEYLESDSNKEKYRAFIEAAGKKGILVMPDYHSDVAGEYREGLHTLNKAKSIALWKTMANKLSGEWNVFAADIFNEPHDVTNDQWGDWLSFCEDAADAIWSTGVNWLVAVEGTNSGCGGGHWCSWGENLEGVKNKKRTFSNTNYGENRFIWSPHVYGKDVRKDGDGWSTAAWQYHWGYLVDGSSDSLGNKAASVIGEFGTAFIGEMVDWLKDLVSYLISIDQRNTFFWCLNPNSSDSKGLLKADWTTPETGKLEQLSRLQPNPSVITYNSGTRKVCVSNLGQINQ